MNPQTEAIFVFCNKSRNRIKILEWDEDGFWIYYKSLEHSHVPWPVPDSKSMVISSNELVTLINSAKLVKS